METPLVRELGAAEEALWEEYVRAHPRATFFHQLGWRRVLEATFPYEPHYLAAWRGDHLAGVLPLFACRSLRGTREFYSLPHTVYGGPVGDDAAVEAALLDTARGLGARRVEFRNRYPNHLDLPLLEGFVTFEKELPATREEVYRTFPKKAREAINQARKRHRLQAAFEDDLDTFYELLAASYLRLGTPVFSRRFFEAMRREFPQQSSILLVRHEGRAVSGVLSMVFRSTIMPLYSGEAPGVSHLKSNNFKYLRLMEEAVGWGLRRFDFGRSRVENEGAVRFKRNQGFEPTPLPYQVAGADTAGKGRADPTKGVFFQARKVWRRLPARVARAIGPRIVRYFP